MITIINVFLIALIICLTCLGIYWYLEPKRKKKGEIKSYHDEAAKYFESDEPIEFTDIFEE
jgi:cbb3-type cytochrome oxidase subunit 3